MEQMLITYKIPRYESCMLINDEGLQKMIQLVRNMGLKKVDLNVVGTNRINDRMDDRRLNAGIRSKDIQIVEVIEMERTSTGNKKIALQSSTSSEEIREVGQKFEGGGGGRGVSYSIVQV